MSTLPSPVFDYSSRDYLSVYSDLQARKPVYLPEWTSTSDSDFGNVMLQMYAYVCDLVGYYVDRLANEAFIQTATQPSSVLNLAAMLDYQPTLSAGATVSLQITMSAQVPGPFVIPAGTFFSTVSSATTAAVMFQTVDTLTIAGANASTASVTGSVLAVQATQHTNEAVATSNGSANQAYALQYGPVSAGSFVVYVDLGLGPQEWAYVANLIDYGPYDQVFTNFVDANGVFYVVFGDGVNGYVPPLGSPIKSTYQTNVGGTGNVGANTITQAVSAIIGLAQVTNSIAANGGAAAESLASIRLNAPASLKAANRAVTVSDMQTLAVGSVPGVQWASAQELTYQIVNLYIAPYGGGAPSALMMQSVDTSVTALSMANTTITVLPPTYIPINISVDVYLYPTYGSTVTQTAINAALQSLLNVDSTGFAFRVSLGLVYQTILSQVGVNWANITNLNRQILTTVTSTVPSATPVTSIPCTPLPQTVTANDVLFITVPGYPTAIQCKASATAPAGATVISVTSFTAPTPILQTSTVQNVGLTSSGTAAADCVLLYNEIPTAGTFTITMHGGLPNT